MLISALNQEFLHHNSNRSYPLSEKATKQPTRGAADFSIPNDFLVAARLTIDALPAEFRIDEFYISRITVFNDGANIKFSYDNKEIGVVSVFETDVPNATFYVQRLNDFRHLTGHVTVGSFASIKNCLGDYTFDLKGGRLDADAIQYVPASVLTVVNHEGAPTAIYGSFKLAEGNNIKITPTETATHTDIFISRVEDSDRRDRVCIRSINLKKPDADGNFWIREGTPCLTIETEEAVMTISENCCAPCCGCEELASLQHIIQDLLNANTEIRLYQQKLEGQLNQLQTTLSITGI